jgi:cobaltochelatase CobN
MLADRMAGYRVFGSMPGAYGAGLAGADRRGRLDQRSDFADAFIAWGGLPMARAARAMRKRAC